MSGLKTTADNFIFFGTTGYTMDTTPADRKLDSRALKARYLRTTQEGQYLVLVVNTKKTPLIRMAEFMLPSASSNRTETDQNRDSNSTNLDNQKKKASAAAKAFPNIHGTSLEHIIHSQFQKQRDNLPATGIRIMEKIKPPPPAPETLARAMASENAKQWAEAWNEEVNRYAVDLKT
eukprot:Plantae.Rhodophyta-Palmaria_palmata.ctg14030.p1 GENE.Plantae.Rhodophyta-Palmaria_palmata.ctg14030~~Plantae.Rhodophyta-Palmaria_palmata.ctg14030.p1  ORF type:complete len:177 (-),score=4.46 Plantae.Rhodophyta-Palmaria_palmata.ctg14030:290-820(-)